VEELDLYPELRGKETLGEIVGRVRNDVNLSSSQFIDRRSRNATALVYGIGFESNDPEKAAKAANRIADLFVEASLERQHRQHQLTTAFLRDELEEAEQVLREQNREIAGFKQRYRGLLPSDLQANLARLDLLQNQRQSLAIQINEAEARVVQLASERPDSPDAQLMALRDELRRMESTYTARHPDRIAPGTRAGTVEVFARSDGAGGTEVEVTYELTALTDEGNVQLARFDSEACAAMLADWERMIRDADLEYPLSFVTV